MNASLIKVGNSYLVKVGKNEIKIRVVRENPNGGWMVSSLAGGSTFLVKDPGRFLRCIETLPVTVQNPAAIPVVGQNSATVPITAQTPAVTAVTAQTSGAASTPALQIAVSALTPPVKKLSMLDAAAEALKNSQVPMNCKEIVAAMESSGLWTPGRGLTPIATISAAIGVEIRRKPNPRFRKTAPGMFEYAGGQNNG